MQKLISLLQQNARLSNAQLAVMLGKTEEEVAADIRKLEEDGIIKGYSVILNEEAINKDMVTAIVELRVTVKGANVKDVSLFVSQRLAPLGNVLSTATYFVLKKYKEMGKIVVDEEKDERGFYFP